MTKKWASLFSLVIILSVLFCGCSTDIPADTGSVPKSDTFSSEQDAASSSDASTAKNTDDDTLVIYSPHDADPMNACIVNFMAAYQDIKVKLIAGGTGELCERIKSEADSPQADVFWGGGADSMQAYSDYFEAFVCSNNNFIDAQFKDPEKKWIGESPLPMVIIYNKKLLSEYGLTPPGSWEDCLNPAFKGRIAYCQPSKSGSAYTQLCTMILTHGGGQTGWEFVQKFVDNLDGKILDSSGKCHKLVASGDYLIGITIEKSAALYLDDPSIGFCYPSEGTSAVADAVAIIKNCPHKENAEIFVNFVTSFASQEEQSLDWNRRPSRSDVPVADGLTDLRDIHVIDYDLKWASDEKENILNHFQSLMNP